MADYDVALPAVKRSGLDVGRKMRFYDDAAGTVAAVVKDTSGNVLTQPIRVGITGQLDLRFDQWPVYFADNRAWTRIKRVPGMPATISGVTQQAHIADASVAYADDGGVNDLDTDAKRVAAMNATNAKINALLAALEAGGVLAAA